MTEESSQRGAGREPSDRESVLEETEALLRVFRGREREAKKVRKALDALRKDGVDRLARVAEARDVLEGFEADDLAEEGERLEGLAAALRRRAMKMATRARMELVGAIDAAAAAADVSFRKLSDRPLTILLSPLTFSCDVDRQTARAAFGKETIEEDITLRAEDLVRARADLVSRLKAEAVDSEVFFERLRKAYRLVLDVQEREAEARVDLVDVMVPLAVVSSERGRWRKKGIGALAPFPRYLLAYQLWKLRRDGLLEHGEARLDLGTATGGSTKDKRDVLFIPTTATEGQYFVSIRFVCTRREERG